VRFNNETALTSNGMVISATQYVQQIDAVSNETQRNNALLFSECNVRENTNHVGGMILSFRRKLWAKA